MATAQNTQQQLDQFNAELDKIEQKIVDSGKLLSTNLSDGFAKAIVEARKLSDPLEDAVSITKKLNKLADENEVLLIKRKIAEENYTKALSKSQQEKTKAAAADLKSAKKDFDKIRAQVQINQGLEDQYRKLVQIAEEEDKIKKEKLEQDKINNALGSKLSKMASLYKDLLGPISILFTFVLNAAKKADTAITDMGKSMGISRDAAAEMYNNFDAYSRASKDGYANALRLSKAQNELTEQLGFQAKFSNEELETYSKLTEIVGLTGDEAAKLNVLSAGTGKTTREYVSDLRKGAFYAQQTNKVNISDKELLSTISKLSAGIAIKFQGNAKAMGQAVIEAKKLGTNLETINKIGDSLLDWESSIENELEAELITGKKINLEKAREAALTGDQLDLTREISDQVGSLAEYQNMNVIAQSSLAKAFGLSRDEMSEMLMQQEAINKYGDKAAELNKTQLEDLQNSGLTLDQYLEKQKEQQSIQQQFNNVMMELEATIGRIANGPLGKMASLIANILSSTTGLAAIMAVYIARQAFSLSLTILDFQAKRRAATMNAADASIEMAKSAAAAPIVGAIVAAGVAIAAFATFASLLSKGESVKDGVIGPSGKILYSGAEGAIRLHDNDTVIAGTNLGGGRRNTGGGGGDSSALISAIDSLHQTMKTKSNDIYMDGEKVGTQVGKQSSTGTQQSINSYRLA